MIFSKTGIYFKANLNLSSSSVLQTYGYTFMWDNWIWKYNPFTKHEDTARGFMLSTALV